MKIFLNIWKKENWEMEARGAPTLRVTRAETRLTVYRSRPYRNSSSAGQKGRLHDGAPGHEKVVFEDHCFLKVLVNYNNSCGAHIEVYRHGIEC